MDHCVKNCLGDQGFCLSISGLISTSVYFPQSLQEMIPRHFHTSFPAAQQDVHSSWFEFATVCGTICRIVTRQRAGCTYMSCKILYLGFRKNISPGIIGFQGKCFHGDTESPDAAQALWHFPKVTLNRSSACVDKRQTVLLMTGWSCGLS